MVYITVYVTVYTMVYVTIYMMIYTLLVWYISRYMPYGIYRFCMHCMNIGQRVLRVNWQKLRARAVLNFPVSVLNFSS